MKQIISAVLLVLSIGTFHAQTKTTKVQVVDGPENDSKRSSVLGFFGYDNTGYYTLRTEKKNTLVEHLNQKMEVDKSIPMEKLTIGKTKLGFHSAQQIGDNLYFFYIQYDSRAKTSTLYAKKINKKTLLTEGELINVKSTKFESRRGLMQTAVYGAYGSFALIKSTNEQELLLISKDIDQNSDGNSLNMVMTVFNSDLKEMWETDYKPKFAGDRFSFTSFELDELGNITLIGIEYEEKSTARASKRAGKPSYQHYLVRFTDKGKDVDQTRIDLTGKFITDLKIATAPSGDLVVAGFYSEKGSFSIKGSFYMRLDPANLSVKAEKISEFDTEFITMNMTDREEKKAKKKEAKGEELEMNEFDMRSLLIAEDGSATLVAEQFIFYVTTHTTYSNGRATTYSVYHYLYNDIICVAFNAEGALKWKCKIPKRQHTTNDGGYYSSYSMAVVGSKIYFVFNDNPKNLFLPKDEAPYNFSGSKDIAVVVVEVDDKGNTTKELLFASERGDALVRPKISLQTAEDEMVICSQRSRIFQFSKLTFKK